MKSNDVKKDTHEQDSQSTMDRITAKTKEVFGIRTDDAKELGKPFQDTPDEGAGDVPQQDKVVKDHRTGEKTFVKNTGDRY